MTSMVFHLLEVRAWLSFNHSQLLWDDCVLSKMTNFCISIMTAELAEINSNCYQKRNLSAYWNLTTT